MRYLTFNERFILPILKRQKVTTIRATSKPAGVYSFRVWTGEPYRSKQREFTKAKLGWSLPITVDEWQVRVNTKLITRGPSLNKFARDEGFDGAGFENSEWMQFITFFETMHRLPFEGYLIAFSLHP